MYSNFLKNALSLVLLPFLFATIWALPTIFFSALKSKNFFYLISGVLLQIIIHFKWRSRTEFLYVLSHELSHALSGILQGIKVKKIQIKKKSGYVVFKGKTNLITELAPYFFPFYAVLLAGVYFLISLFYKIQDYKNLFFFLEGFFISFHILNTIEIMAGPLQSDFKKAGGKFFSYIFVILLNIFVVLIIFKLLFPNLVEISLFIKESLNNFKSIISKLVFLFKLVFNTAKIYFNQQ